MTVLIFALLSFFGAEILTGSTSIEGTFIFPLSFLAGLAFYGFQISIIADIAIRYRLGMRTIYLIGLFYGIMEEGIAIFTMESTTTHTLWLSLVGLNITWTVYVMILHAVITVSTTLIIVRVLWPHRISEPFLSRRKYALMIPVTAVIYVFLMLSAINSGRAPQLFPVLILVVTSIVIFIAARQSNRVTRKRYSSEPSRSYVASGSIPLAIGMIVPFIIGNRIPFALVPETVLLVILLFYFYSYFRKMDSDNTINSRKLWSLYTSFLAVMLIGGVFNRTVPSDIIAVAGVLILSSQGFIRSSRKADS